MNINISVSERKQQELINKAEDLVDTVSRTEYKFKN